MLLENTGTAFGKSNDSRHKRLKRGDEDAAAASRGLDDMFSDDEEEADMEAAPTRDRRDNFNEFDDFIEEDEFSDEDQGRDEQQERRRPQQQSQAAPARLSGLDEDKMGELYEVFGDGADYEWALEGEDEMGAVDYVSDEEEKAGPELKDVFEPGELKARLLTDEDNIIRSKDIPERFQILRATLSDEYEINDKEFEQEYEFILEKFKDEIRYRFESKEYLIQPFKDSLRKALEFITKENLEVPFISTHRKDYLVYSVKSNSDNFDSYDEQLITVGALWYIVQLDIEFRTIILKKRSVEAMFESVDSFDLEFKEMFEQATKLIDYQDLTDYIQFKYSSKLKDIAASKGTGSKRHSRFGRFERIRDGPLYELVRAFGMTSEQFAVNLSSMARIKTVDNPTESPEEYAQKFIGTFEDGTPTGYSSAAQALEAAQQMAIEEICNEPKVRKILRDVFWREFKVMSRPTEKGKAVIDETHPYYYFKYAMNLGYSYFLENPHQYLQMLQAESEGLIDVRIDMHDYKNQFVPKIVNLYNNDEVSTIAEEWKKVRTGVITTVLKRIIPLVCNHIKESIRLDCIRELIVVVRDSITKKLDQAPFQPKGYKLGSTARILSMSCGMGNFGKDAILAVVMDEHGEVIEYAKMEDPRDTEFKAAFVDLVNRRSPDVVGISGFTVNSNKFFEIVQQIVKDEGLTCGADTEAVDSLQVVWVQDEVARLYQHSQRSQEEFPDQVTLSRYCIGLARYLQSPLLEYANLGKEITGLYIHEYQHLLPDEVLMGAVEAAFVNIVNMVGVDINECIRNSYYGTILQYVSGLGPRKASGMIQGIQSYGGTLSNRAELIMEHITTKQVFMNCASFLKFPVDSRSSRSIQAELLDATRIHPEDYDIARKMAADALELDEEDWSVDDSSGGVIAQLTNEGPEKLNDLILEEYADELEKKFHQKKKNTLEQIKTELIDNYGELRRQMKDLSVEQVFTMLTGETAKSLAIDTIVPVNIRKVTDKALTVSLACGIEGTVPASNMFDGNAPRAVHPGEVFAFGQTVRAIVVALHMNHFLVELTTAPQKFIRVEQQRKYLLESAPYRLYKVWDHKSEEADLQKEKERQEKDKRQKRVIKHPFFRPFDARQAETFLASMQRGGYVIRPSSKGMDHIAITWKVADQLFQHVDVLELNKKNEYSVGEILQVGQSRYTDLDELIVMHIQAMAAKVEELVSSEKFQDKPLSEVENWLKTYTHANPKRSTYAFCFNHKHAGYFYLLFQTGANSPIQRWDFKVIPNGFKLFGNEYPDVPSLSNGFKLIFQNKMRASGHSGGRSSGSHRPGGMDGHYGHAGHHQSSRGYAASSGYR